MLRRRRHAAQGGQTLILAVAFLAFFGLVATSVLTFASTVESQRGSTERTAALNETAVIINEFGDVSLDHLLVEYVSDNMVLLQSGCLCCTLRGDLVDALETLLRDLDNRRCTFRRVLLETTGLADPAPVLHTAIPAAKSRNRLPSTSVTT